MMDYPEKDKNYPLLRQRPTIVIIEGLIIVLIVVLIGRNLFPASPQNTVTTVVVTPTLDANVLFEQAELLRDAEQYSASIPMYTQALEAGYTPVSRAYFGRAYSRYEINDYEAAIEDYTRAIEADPGCEYECPYHYYNRGLAYYQLQNNEQAIYGMTLALEMRPDYVNALRFRAKIYIEQGETEKALLDWQRVFELRQTRVIERGLSAEGGTHTALLDEEGQQLHVVFEGSAGTLVTLRTTDSDFDSILLLTDSEGTPLAFDDDSGTGGHNARISNFELPADGEYRVLVAGYDEDETGSVTLVMETGRIAVPASEFPVITQDNVTDLTEVSQFARLDDNAGIFSPDGQYFYEDTAINGIVRYPLADSAPRYQQVVAQDEYYAALAVGENGAILAAAAGDDAIIFDIAESKRLLVMYDAEISMTDLAFSPDMSLLAGASISDKIYLWDTVTGKPVFTLVSENAVVSQVAFSPDGRWLASGGSAGTIEIWNVQTGKLETTWATGYASEMTALLYSPDSAAIAGADEHGNLWLWAATTGDLLSRVATNDRAAHSITFSPDAKLLAFGNQRGEIIIFQSGEGTGLTTLTAHEKSVQNLAFSPDGTTLYSAGADDTVRIWRISDK